MKNFIFKSQGLSTYKKLFQSIETIQKNVLYLTYQMDALTKEMKKLTVDKGIQQQVDEYFDETSHQTDTDDKEPD